MIRPRFQRPPRRAFTMVEMLVVLGIIVILASILFPAIGKVRESAREADTRSSLNAIENACQAYFTDFSAFPGPLSSGQLAGDPASGLQTAMYASAASPSSFAGTVINTGTVSGTGIVTGDRITESENLVLGLIGGLQLNRTLTPARVEYDVPSLDNGPANLNPTRPSTYTAYLSKAARSDGTVKFTDAGRKQAHDTVIPEIVDRWPNPLPFLVLRARNGAKGNAAAAYGDANNNVVVNAPGVVYGQYNLIEITPYTQSAIGADVPDPSIYHGRAYDPNAPHGLTNVYSGEGLDPKAQYPFGAFTYLSDPSSYDTTQSAAVQLASKSARKKDSIIIISAGRDRLYGTLDDVTNFGAIKP